MNNFKFVRVKVVYVAGKIDPETYERAIEENAAAGWDFVQIFVENPAASASEHVIIFKRTRET